jgi:sugar phosphate isomerase/epimerase
MKKIIFADKFDFADIKKAGFDGIFIKPQNREHAIKTKELCDKHSLIFSSLHGPSIICNLMYTDTPEPYIAQQTELIDLAHELGVKFVITHATLHIDTPPYNPLAVERYKKLFDYAYRKGVTLCIENLEHEHIVFLFNELYGYKGGGFCLDTGHNNAYTPHLNFERFTPVYLHLNDNFGMTGKTYDGIDDLHLIPYDGNADFERILSNLKRQGYDGELTFELKKHNSDLYKNLSDKEFLEKAYSVACDIENKIKG